MRSTPALFANGDATAPRFDVLHRTLEVRNYYSPT